MNCIFRRQTERRDETVIPQTEKSGDERIRQREQKRSGEKHELNKHDGKTGS